MMADRSVRRRILLIEDDIYIARAVSDILTLEGYEVRVSVTGGDGLSQLAEFAPDLILLDVMLPDMSGFDVASTIVRNTAGTVTKPSLFFLSAMGQEEDINRGMSCGADGYITKPFNPSSLLEIVASKVC